MAKTKFTYEKRQRELAKKKQQDEKQVKKRVLRENAKLAGTESGHHSK